MFAPSLTGLGDRAELLGPDIGLARHVQDIVELVTRESLTGVVLVAHSYGGAVVTGALSSLAQSVRRLIFLDGHVPLSGRSVLDTIGAERAARVLQLAEELGDSWRVPVTDDVCAGVDAPDDRRWILDHASDQPLKTYQDKIQSSRSVLEHPCTFVEFDPTHLAPSEVSWQRQQAADRVNVRHRVLAAGHSALITQPQLVADLIRSEGELVSLCVPDRTHPDEPESEGTWP